MERIILELHCEVVGKDLKEIMEKVAKDLYLLGECKHFSIVDSGVFENRIKVAVDHKDMKKEIICSLLSSFATLSFAKHLDDAISGLIVEKMYNETQGIDNKDLDAETKQLESRIGKGVFYGKII